MGWGLKRGGFGRRIEKIDTLAKNSCLEEDRMERLPYLGHRFAL